MHTEILPQNESLLRPIWKRAGSSGLAWMRTGTSSFDILMVSATPRSSPKFGRVTITPSILSELSENNWAHFLASSNVSTAPNFVSPGPRITASHSISSMTLSISSRPSLTNSSGKKPLLPTITPNTGFMAASILFLYIKSWEFLFYCFFPKTVFPGQPRKSSYPPNPFLSSTVEITLSRISTISSICSSVIMKGGPIRIMSPAVPLSQPFAVSMVRP